MDVETDKSAINKRQDKQNEKTGKKGNIKNQGRGKKRVQ